MSYEWRQEFEDGQTRATCSKCGVPYRWPDELVKLDDGFFYCKRRCLEQTVLARDKIIAQSRKRREMPPPKFVQAPRYADDYLLAEGEAFKVVMNTALTSSDTTDIAWAVNYLADMVTQGLRPVAWNIRAKTGILRCCDLLLTQQQGSPTGSNPTLAVGRVRYGGVGTGTTLATSTTAAAGLALAKGYQVLGTQTYLDGAMRCAHFMRNMQCQDLDNNAQYTTWGGGRYHIGGLANGITTSGTITWTTAYTLYDAGLAAWFLQVMSGLQATTTAYGAASSVDYTSTTVATLATMLTELVAFMVTGPNDAYNAGAPTTGLSTTRPRSYYSAQANGSTNVGAWLLQTATASPYLVLYGRDFAAPLLALNLIGGYTPTVQAVYDWLMTFTANPANAAPVEDDQLLIGTTVGTYNPKVAIADTLDVVDASGASVTYEHAGAVYDWMSTALLAPIASVRDPVDFKASKDTLSVPQPSARGPAPSYKYIGQVGRSGLSLQITS